MVALHFTNDTQHPVLLQVVTMANSSFTGNLLVAAHNSTNQKSRERMCHTRDFCSIEEKNWINQTAHLEHGQIAITDMATLYGLQ